MRSLLTSILLLVIINTVVLEDVESAVIEASDKDFEDLISSSQHNMVMFMIPHCLGCSLIHKAMEEAHDILKVKEYSINFIAIDVKANQAIKAVYQINHYPTIEYINNEGDRVAYKGNFDAKSFANWLQKKMNPPSIHVDDLESLEIIKKRHSACIVYFGGSEDNEGYRSFVEASKSHETIHFYHSTVAELINKYGDNKIVLFTEHDFGEVPLELEINKESILNHIYVNRHELVALFADDLIIERVFEQQHPALVFFTDNENHPFLDDFKELALEDRIHVEKHIIFVRSHIEAHEYGNRLADYMGISKDQDPSMYIIIPKENDFVKFRFESEITKSSIKKFLLNWRDNSLVRYYKTEETKLPTEAIIQDLAGKDFEKVVLNSSKPSVLLLYIHYQAHSTNFIRKLEEVAFTYKEQSKLQELSFFKIDTYFNDIPGYQFPDAPVMLVFIGGKGIRYNGRDIPEEMKEFIDHQFGWEKEDQDL